MHCGEVDGRISKEGCSCDRVRMLLRTRNQGFLTCPSTVGFTGAS
jgi:hypothetical protein